MLQPKLMIKLNLYVYIVMNFLKEYSCNYSLAIAWMGYGISRSEQKKKNYSHATTNATWVNMFKKKMKWNKCKND